MPPFPSQHSTPGRLWREADPKVISGRARYHRVRLAFHPYPQVIPRRCTTYGFGPPCAVKRTSSCPWVDHPASGLHPVTGRPVRTRFRCGSTPEGLSLATERNSPAHTAKGTRSPTPGPSRGSGQAPTALWADGFTFYFTPLPGSFSPFPRGTGALSVSRWYLALEGGPPSFAPDFTCPTLLGMMTRKSLPFRLRDVRPLRSPFPVALLAVRLEKALVTSRGPHRGLRHHPTTPHGQRLWPCTHTVWAPPRSLAATRGISVDFSSSRY